MHSESRDSLPWPAPCSIPQPPPRLLRLARSYHIPASSSPRQQQQHQHQLASPFLPADVLPLIALQGKAAPQIPAAFRPMQSLASIGHGGRRIGDIGSPRDEDLFIFNEVRRREREWKQASRLSPFTIVEEDATLASKLRSSSVTSRPEDEISLASKLQLQNSAITSRYEHDSSLANLRSSSVCPTSMSDFSKFKGLNDSFSTELEKNDFNWLLTPPATPLLTISHEHPPTADLSVREAVTLIQSLAPSKISKFGDATELTTRSLRQPSSKATLESSAMSSKKGTPFSHGSATNTGSRYSADAIGKAASSITVKSVASSRSTTLAERQITQILHHNHSSTTSSRSASVSKASSISSRSASSSRGSSPTKYPPCQLSTVPGLSVEPPANLRTTVPEQAVSSARSTFRSSRQSFPNIISTSGSRHESSATGTHVSGPHGSNQQRQKSRSPTSSRGHKAPDTQRIKNANLGSGISANGIMEGSAPMVAGSKMVEKLMQARRSAAVSKEGQHKKTSSLQPVLQAKQPSKMSTTPPLSTVPSRESSGFGRNISKNSLDMALRHMDIKNMFGGSCPSISNNLTSSTSSICKDITKANPHRSVAPPLAAVAHPQTASGNRSLGCSSHIKSSTADSEQGDEDLEYKLSSLPDFEFSISKEDKFSSWFNSYSYRDDSIEIMQLFKQGIERFTGFESPLVCQHGRTSDCDRCKL